jgi:hypothetical protein
MNYSTLYRSTVLIGITAAAIGFAASAQATDYTYSVGTIAAATPYTQLVNHLVSDGEPVGTSFMDLFNFQVAGTGVSSVAVNLDLSPFLSIPDLQLGLYSGQNALGSLLAGPVSSGVTLTQMLMTNTDYSLKVNGTTAGLAGGSYTLGIAAQVPEADNWLTMLAGIAIVGLMARRSGRV